MGLSSYGSKKVVTLPNGNITSDKEKLRNQIVAEDLKEIAPQVKKTLKLMKVRDGKGKVKRNRATYMKWYRNQPIICPNCKHQFREVNRATR